jgi:hypothetical protein
MEESPMTKTASPLRRIVTLAVVLVVIAALHKLTPQVWSYSDTLRMVLSGLYILWLLLFTFQLFRAVLYFRVARGKATALMVSVYEQGILRTLWDVYRRQAFHELRLSVLFLIWSLVIFGIVACIAWTGAVDEFELRFLPTPDSFQNQDTLYSVRVLTLVTDDNNAEKYLKNLAQLVDALGKLGARAVVAEQPWMLRGETSVMIDSLRHMKLLTLYESAPSFGTDKFVTTSSVEEKERYAEWPILLEVTLPLAPSPNLGRIIRWYPFLNTGSLFKLDVSVAVAADILGYPDTVKPAATRGSVTFGDLSIPVSLDGEALSLRSVRFDRLFVDFGAIRSVDADTLKFIPYTDARRGSVIPQENEPEIRGKTIIISWFVDAGRYRFLSGRDGVLLASIIESLLRGKVFKQYGHYSLLLAAAMIALSALLCFRIRLRTSVPIVLSIGIAMFLVGVWLMLAHFVLLNIAYPTVAALLSAIIHPLVRLSHENPIER